MNAKQIQAMALQYIAEKTQEQMLELAMSDAPIDPIGLSGWFAEYYDFEEWISRAPKFAPHANQIFTQVRFFLGLES